MTASSQRSPALMGTVRAPGDKSISHRALIFGALASGETIITGLLEGADILSTAGAMRSFGASVEKQKDGRWKVTGCGEAGFSTPKTDVDCGNAGTGVRLIMGAASGFALTAKFTGDASLSVRPMGRVLNPLSDMGISYEAQDGGRLPVSEGTTTVTEPTLSRDHTENMLKAFGAEVTVKAIGRGQKVSVKGPVTLKATDVTVPGDPSSAAFPIVAALITLGSDVTIENVMMNPTRVGLFETLTEMGAYLRSDNFRTSGGEVIADIQVKYSKLHGVTVPPERAPSMIDEYPVLAIAAAYASGTTTMRGIAEMRVKESDRISATVALLKENGVETTEFEDGFAVKGGSVAGGGVVTTHHDHRIAMSALILGLQADAPVSIDDSAMIATSFPTFFDLMKGLGAKIT